MKNDVKPAVKTPEASAVDPGVIFLPLSDWLMSGEHLPKILQDFHDQKDLFKKMHSLYRDSEQAPNMPNWVDGQIYTIDWFLWFMAARGYTLQKSRKKVKFRPLED